MPLVVILLSVLMLSGVGSARTVEFVGETPVNAGPLRSVAEAVMGDDALADSLVLLLEGEGYLESDVAVTGDSVRIEAGTRSMLTSLVDATGRVLIDDVDKAFTPETVQQATELVLEPYRDSGYYYATTSVRTVRADSHQISLVVAITPGPVLRVTSVSFVGLERTDESLIARYLSIDSGDVVTRANIERWRREAAELAFIDLVPPLDIRPRPGFTGADLAFRFVEKQSARIEGAAGYLPDDPAGLVWTLDAALLNLFGGGRRADLRSERRERGRNLFEVGYSQPIFLLGTGTAGLSVATRDYRDSFYEFGVDLLAESQLFESFSVGVNVGWKTVEPSGPVAGYRRFLAGFTVARQSLDDRLNPRSGIDLRWQISYANRVYRDDTLVAAPPRRSLNDTRTDVRVDWYLPVVSSLVGRLGVRYNGLETSEQLPPLSELILVGGPGSIRGYRNEQFAVLRAAVGTIEPRLRFDAGYLFAFYDAGYTSERRTATGGGVETVEQYLQSYGLGLSLTGQGRNGGRSITLSLGWSAEADFDQPRLSVELEAGL